MRERVDMTTAEMDDRLANPTPHERPWATFVRYDASRDELQLGLDGGTVLSVPRDTIEELRGLPKSHMRDLRLMADGHALSLRRDDIDISIPGLVRDLVGFGCRALHPNQLASPRARSRRSGPSKKRS